VGLFLFKNEFVYQNQFLENTFNEHFIDNDIDARISPERKINNVHSENGDFLFSIDFSEDSKFSALQEVILFALYLISFFLVASCFWLFLNVYFKRIQDNLKILLLLIFLCLFRFILFYFRLFHLNNLLLLHFYLRWEI